MVVAVTEHLGEYLGLEPSTGKTSLTCLTMAAMALPGLMMQPVCAGEGDSVSFVREHYSEGKRDIGGFNSKFQPIRVDSILGNINFSLDGELKGVVTLTQDTWSGATPVATAPVSAHGNRETASHTHVMTGASMDTSGHIHDDEEGDMAAPIAHAISGASPYLYSALKLDAQYRPLMTNSEGKVVGGVDTHLVHTLSSASPEVRQQWDLTISRQLKGAKVNAGGGFSNERDFSSLFGNVSGSWDFNRKLTTLSAGLSYAHNKTVALLDHDLVPHVYEPYMLTYERRGDDTYNRSHASSQLALGKRAPTLTGERDDWGVNVGATQILNQSALLETTLSFTHSLGYQSNPYKAVEVAFIDPLKQKGQAGGNSTANYTYDAELVAILEQRPDLRNQGSLNLKYIQHIAATDAALHLGYRYFQDTWSIRSHTWDAEWIQPLSKTWSLTPRLRYYSQTQADFYTAYLTTNQGLYNTVTDPAKGAIYIDTRNTTNGIRYYEDATGTLAPPQDTNPSSRKFGQAVVGAHGRAVINQNTGAAVSDQATVDALKQDTLPFDRTMLPAYYSSDQRLSGFGTLTAGVALTKNLGNGANLELSYDQIRHAGNLKMGGGGEGRYADFDAYVFNLGLNIDLDETRRRHRVSSQNDHSDPHHAHPQSHALPAPAGVQLDHLLANRGDMMVSYRFMGTQLDGNINYHGNPSSDYALINHACYGHPCYVRPTNMTMSMYMLDIMYAPTDWLTLMVMPQFVGMNMDMRLLDESPRNGGMDAIGMAITHAENRHTTSGLGDTEFHGLINLLRLDNAELHLGLGLSAPTAAVDVKMRPMMGNDMGFYEYGMQLGSGTWDFKPSLTMTGQTTYLAWGAQISHTKRLEDQNDSGYTLGDQFQSTLWSSRALNRTFSASLRGVYSEQGAINGAFNNTHVPISTGDYPQNTGGHLVDVGLGLAATINSGAFAGTAWSLEWLEPVADRPQGYQLERKGTLVFNWGIHL